MDTVPCLQSPRRGRRPPRWNSGCGFSSRRWQADPGPFERLVFMRRRKGSLAVLLALAALVSLATALPTVADSKPADVDAPPPPLSPAEAVKRFKVADGLAIGLAVSEP